MIFSVFRENSLWHISWFYIFEYTFWVPKTIKVPSASMKSLFFNIENTPHKYLTEKSILIHTEFETQWFVKILFNVLWTLSLILQRD